jgi:transcriptional regulator with XRE-family HTH domain
VVTLHHSKQSALKRYRLYRGLYARVARQLGVDRSYVSRVARGERRSPRVEAALKNELRRIEQG